MPSRGKPDQNIENESPRNPWPTAAGFLGAFWALFLLLFDPGGHSYFGPGENIKDVLDVL